jgi:hypothetical protein
MTLEGKADLSRMSANANANYHIGESIFAHGESEDSLPKCLGADRDLQVSGEGHIVTTRRRSGEARQAVVMSMRPRVGGS